MLLFRFVFFENFLQKKKRPQLLGRRSLFPVPIACGKLLVRSQIYSGLCLLRCTQRLLRIWKRSWSWFRFGFVRMCTIYAKRQWMKTIGILIMILIEFIHINVRLVLTSPLKKEEENKKKSKNIFSCNLVCVFSF